MPDIITPSTIIMGSFCLAIFAIALIGEQLEKKYKGAKRGATRNI